MISDWKETRLVDVVSILGDGLHGTPKYDKNGEYYFINGNNLSKGKIVFKDDTKRVSQTEYEKYKKNLNDRTILVSINGTLGNVALYNGEKCILGKSACYFNVKDEVDKQFIKYVVSTRHFKEYISRFANGTTIKNVSLKVMRNYEFLLPHISEQQAIGSTLSCIDNKIELNNTINKNLEEMAQTLFKRWFVDFEFPNENGEPYKSSGGEFEESELGLIPKGWRVGTATEIFDVQSGGTPKTGNFEYWNGDIPFFTPKDCTNSFYVINTEKQITEVGLSKCNSKLYKAGTVFITARGTVGKLSIAGQDMAMNQSCYALVATKDFTQKYIFLQTQLLINAIKKNASGAVFDAITVSTFQSLKVVIPNIELVVKFDKVVESIFNSILKNINENQILSDSRDTLLPKLMSGEIRVPIEREYVQTADLPMAAESIEQYSTT